MIFLKRLLVLALIAPVLSYAQTTDPTFSPPPLVDAPSTDAPRVGTPPSGQPGPGGGPATPPPPGYSTPPGAPQYGQPGGMPYSPYMPYAGAPMPKPGPEYGLMVTESLFGMLTAAATGLIPYVLLFDLLGPAIGLTGPGSNSTISTILFLAIFAAVPLAVSETEGNLANGSRYYLTEGWVAPLSGLLSQAAIVGLYAWLHASGPAGVDVPFLLIGTVVLMPLAEMAAINLFKVPRFKMSAGPTSGLLNYAPGDGLHAGLPMPQPFLGTTSTGLTLGVQFPLFAGRF